MSTDLNPSKRTDAGASVSADAGGTGTIMLAARIALIALGLLGLAWGAYVMLDSVKPANIPGVALWIGVAIVLHDGILAPIVFFCGVLMRRAGQSVGGTVVQVVQGAIVVGGIVTLIVVPLFVADGLGNSNPTVLPLNYGLNFAIFWAVLAAVTSAISLALFARSRRAHP